MTEPLFRLTSAEVMHGFHLLGVGFDLPPELRELLKNKGLHLENAATIDSLLNKVSWGSLITQPNHPKESYLIISEGDDYCIYRAFSRCGTKESPKQVHSDELISALCDNHLYRVVCFKHCLINERVSLDPSNLQGSAGRFTVGTEFLCLSCTFTDAVGLINIEFQKIIDFEGSVFKGMVLFRYITFNEDAGFIETIFEANEVRFNGSFKKKADFLASTFHKGPDFSSTYFEGPVCFAQTDFNEGAGFGHTVSNDKAIFQGATFKAAVDFSETVFRRTANFEETTFWSRADFTGAQFAKRALFRGVRYWPNSLGQWWRHKLLNQWFGCLMWKKKGGQEQPRWVTRQFLPPEKYPRGRPLAATQFLIETENISGMSNPFFKRYIADTQFIEDFALSIPTLGWLWRWSSDYGRSLVLWGFWSALIAMSFGIVYSDIPLPHFLDGTSLGEFLVFVNPELKTNSNDVWFTPYYFSIVTFTTLGFGDVTPNNIAGQFWIVFEVIFGYIMLGGLISIFSNKLARRS